MKTKLSLVELFKLHLEVKHNRLSFEDVVKRMKEDILHQDSKFEIVKDLVMDVKNTVKEFKDILKVIEGKVVLV